MQPPTSMCTGAFSTHSLATLGVPYLACVVNEEDSGSLVFRFVVKWAAVLVDTAFCCCCWSWFRDEDADEAEGESMLVKCRLFGSVNRSCCACWPVCWLVSYGLIWWLAVFDKDDVDDDDNEDEEYEDDAERIGEWGGVVVVVVPLDGKLLVGLVAPLFTTPVELSFRWCFMIFWCLECI